MPEAFWMGVVVGFLVCMAIVLAFGPGFFARTIRKFAEGQPQQPPKADEDEYRKPGDEWKPKGWKPEYED